MRKQIPGLQHLHCLIHYQLLPLQLPVFAPLRQFLTLKQTRYRRHRANLSLIVNPQQLQHRSLLLLRHRRLKQ